MGVRAVDHVKQIGGDASEHDHGRAPRSARVFPATTGLWRIVDVVGITGILVVALILRFWTYSPMWLDEALTVHIASQPLSQIPAALRHDGHPPLYYVLLHGWMVIFGTSNAAIRALPGIVGVLTLPAAWLVAYRVAGRTAAWATLIFVAVMPFAVRYSTENRMYSLLMLFALLGWLFAESNLRKPRATTTIALAGCTAAMLWSQYWSIWLGMAAALIVIAMAIRDRLRGHSERRKGQLLTLGGLAIGALSFVPWVPTMLYQQAHTGTPWAARSLPPTVIVTSVQALGGPRGTTDQVAGWIFSAFILIGVFGIGVASGRILVDLRGQPRSRGLAALAVFTLLIGTAVMVLTNSAFQPRYNSVWLPFAFVLGGIGVTTIRGPLLQRCAIAIIVLASLPGNYQNITLPRTQSGLIANAIEANGHAGDIVAVCPDQLGPSLTRVLRGNFEVGSFPTFSDPHTVDWVDYVARTHAATPEQFADQLVALAKGEHRIFVVWSDRYITHKNLCTQVVQLLGTKLPENRELLEAGSKYFEAATLTMFDPARS